MGGRGAVARGDVGSGGTIRCSPNMRFRDLFAWRGTLGRGPYVGAGVGLFAVKYLLDRVVSEPRG